ncbi:hypothetical protein [Kitasatospora sp. NPDC005856]|uniref:hypothetical protein n=1 Tax=Kitasatospora sp. NPDC005856 TaxID=3154566 RepID=UPI0033EB1622
MRIGVAQLATGRGDAMLRQYVGQRVDAVVCRRLDELLQDGHRRGLRSALPASGITRGAVERLPDQQVPRGPDRTAADLLRAAVDTVCYGAIRSADPGADGAGLRAIIPTVRDGDQEVGSWLGQRAGWHW